MKSTLVMTMPSPSDSTQNSTRSGVRALTNRGRPASFHACRHRWVWGLSSTGTSNLRTRLIGRGLPLSPVGISQMAVGTLRPLAVELDDVVGEQRSGERHRLGGRPAHVV